MGISAVKSPEQLLSQVMLKNARLQAGWTVQSVAHALNLTPPTIRMLEAGDFHKLHGKAFVIGYMRMYAELMGLDGDLIIAHYKRNQLASDGQLNGNPSTQAFNRPQMHASRLSMHFQHNKYHTRYGVAAAMALAVVVGMLSHQAVPAMSTAPEHIVIQTAVGTTVLDSLDQLPDNEPTKGMLPQFVWAEQVNQQQANTQLNNRILGKTDDTAVVGTLLSALSFQFSADCWVEITDGHDQIIYSSMQRADDTLELSGKPPFRITLGYAPGVELSYNGRQVTIDENSGNIAKLILGNS